jgi:hypothetical protein
MNRAPIQVDPEAFVVHRHTIPCPPSGRHITLWPFGDMHRDSRLFALDAWDEFATEAKATPHSYFLGMGDYTEFASATERKALSIASATLHDEQNYKIEVMARKVTDRVVADLSFMKGRILGLLEGNHTYIFPDGTTITQKLCERLECQYLGAAAFVRLSVERSGSQRTALDIYAHHGLGAARLVGGSLNRVQYLAEMAEADIYLMGHDHRRGIAMGSRMKLTDGTAVGLRVKERRQLYIRTGSFVKAYEAGTPSYVSRKALNPADLGVVRVLIEPKRVRVRRKDMPGHEKMDLVLGARL